MHVWFLSVGYARVPVSQIRLFCWCCSYFITVLGAHYPRLKHLGSPGTSVSNGATWLRTCFLSLNPMRQMRAKLFCEVTHHIHNQLAANRHVVSADVRETSVTLDRSNEATRTIAGASRATGTNSLCSFGPLGASDCFQLAAPSGLTRGFSSVDTLSATTEHCRSELCAAWTHSISWQGHGLRGCSRHPDVQQPHVARKFPRTHAQTEGAGVGGDHKDAEVLSKCITL